MDVLKSNVNDWATRDLLLMDFSLESVCSARLQTSNKHQSSSHSWMSLLTAFIQLWSLHDPTNDEWASLSADWNDIGHRAISNTYTRNVRDDALLCKVRLMTLSLLCYDPSRPSLIVSQGQWEIRQICSNQKWARQRNSSDSKSMLNQQRSMSLLTR